MTYTEREVKARRAEVQRQEHRLQQKEESLDKKSDNLDKKEDQIQEKLKAAEARLTEAEQLKKSQFDMLERISGYTEEQAKAQILRPSLPIMRPFISSLGSGTTETVASAT